MIHLPKQARIGTLFMLVVLLNAGIVIGQVVTGTIFGRVSDTTGAVVPGASVQIQNVDTGYSQTARTDTQGRYLSRNLPLGSYTVTVQQPGFQAQVQRGIVLTVGSEVTVNIELSIGNVQERVEVTAEAPLIETTNATVSGLVDQGQMRDLPLNGRSIDQLALLSPGVLNNKIANRNMAVGVGAHLSINGARPDSNLFLLDGTVTNDGTNNSHGSATGQSLGVEGIREFRILTHSFSAEYGRNAGGVMSAVTRAGTNEFHGSVYEFVRNNIFDARNFFNPAELPAFRRNQFGAAAGGPLIRDKIFFFANYEGLRERKGNTVIASVPDLDARRGFIGGQPVTLNPVVVPYLNLYPLPNGRNFGDGTGEYITDVSSPTTEDYAMQRMDFRLSDNDSFYWRYIYNPSKTSTPLPIPTFVNVFTHTSHLAVVSETHIFSGASLNEFRFAFNRTTPFHNSVPLIEIDPSLSFIPGEGFGTLGLSTMINVQLQVSTLGNSPSGRAGTVQNLFQATDTFSSVRGAHSLKFGVDLQRVQLNAVGSTNSRGAYQFGGLTDILAGQPSRVNFLLLGDGSTGIRGWRRILFGWFVQDDYRLSSRLTLNLGLRHEFFTAPTEVNGLSSSLRNITDPANTPGPPFETPKLNFSPRAGLAWDPTGSGKTSVRLGGGLFYNHVVGRTWYGNAGTNADFFKSYQLTNPPFPNALAAGIPTGALQSNYYIQFHSDTPTVVHYNVDVQRNLRPTLSLRAGYVGSIGYNQPRYAERNIRIPQILPDGSKFFVNSAPRVNPNFSRVAGILTDTSNNYNSLQLALQKTASSGLLFQASYTYAKSMSEADQIIGGQIASIPSTPMDPDNQRAEYSLSGYDQRQTFVFNSSYLMPWDHLLTSGLAKAAFGGWAIRGIFSYGSGLPFNIGSGFNNSRNGDPNQPDRPNLALGASNNPIEGVTAGCTNPNGSVAIPAGQQLRTPGRWFDPCAFDLPAAGFYGNLGRLTVTQPGLVNVDFTILKTTTITEEKKLEFRAEFFNVFNHANFGLPTAAAFNSSRARSGNAGRITSTKTDNRQIQLGMKLIF